MKLVILASLFLLAGSVHSEERRQLPFELFGVPLGAIVRADPEAEDRLRGLPSVVVKSAEVVLGHGIHVYFKPLKEFEGFPYIERSMDDSDPFPKTSFRLYLLPVIPDSVTTREQLTELSDSKDLEFEVTLIEWYNESADENEEWSAYSNARRLCATFSLDFEVQPDIHSQSLNEWHTYICDFEQENRMFRVIGQYGATRVSLQDTEAVSDLKERALEEKFRRFELESIRPY